MTRKYSILLNEQKVFIQGYYKLPLEQIIWIFQKYLDLSKIVDSAEFQKDSKTCIL